MLARRWTPCCLSPLRYAGHRQLTEP